MEIKREPLDTTRAPTDFRARQLLARDMLRGDLEGEALDQFVEQAVMTTTLDKAVAWSHGILRLRDKIQGRSPEGWRDRYDAVGTEEVVPFTDAMHPDGAINVFPGGDTAGA